MLSDKFEDGWLDVNAFEASDVVHQKATRRLSCTDAYHKYASGVRVEKHRYMGSHDLLVLTVFALPQSIYFECE